ncbi:MAG TPA: RimK/LysX family protein [Bacteriovoracaceae bacterium]|nr:RimK/LysX family protein [Bacteriovoracaceae bacterium]
METEIKVIPNFIGWREWIGLPGIGLVAIKAKVDTGAKTSSLHAFDISLESKAGRTWVNFKVHPLQGDFSVVVSCRSPLVDKRMVTDSGGHKEERYVIVTTMAVGPLKQKIELTLTNRETMKYRMLIGRAALTPFYIDPKRSYLSAKTLKQRKFLRVLRIQQKKIN